MQQKQTFSAQTLTLSVAAAELGRAIFGAGQTGSVRAVLLSNVLAAAAFVLLAALASVNASRLNRPGFAGKCICAVFLLWYLFELVRTAAMLQQAAGNSLRLWPPSACCRSFSGQGGASAVSCTTGWPPSSGGS